MSDFDTGIPNIRVIIREASDQNLIAQIPNIAVKLIEGSQYNVNVVPNTITTLRTGSFNTYSDFAGVAGTAITASYISGSNVTAEFAISASYATTSSYATTAVSSSLSTTASYALNAAGSGFPFSGSAVITGSLNVTQGITGSLFGTSSNAITASYALRSAISNQIATGSVTASVNIDSASFQLNNGSSTLLFISSSGFVGIGVTASTAIPTFGGPYTIEVKEGIRVGGGFYGTSDGAKQFVIERFSNNSFADELAIRKGRGTGQSPSAVISGDEIGGIEYYGYDGTAFMQTAKIYSHVDGDVSSSRVPGRLSFWVNSGSSSTANIEAIRINASGSVGIGTTAPTNRLQVQGNVSASSYTSSINNAVGFLGTASYANNANLLDGLDSTVFTTTGSNQFNGNQTITGSLVVSDNIRISGSLYSASLNNSVSAGTSVIATVPTASYDAVFFDYVVKRNNNYRVGTVMSTWYAGTSTIEYTDVSTNDIGNTSEVNFTVDVSQSVARLNATVTNSGWIIKTNIRAL